MARKSGWQEFAENFQSTYGIVNKVKQGYDTKQVMDDEKFMAEGKGGAGLSGGALEKARYKALGDIYTKYGNAKDGLAMRTQLADLDSKDRENTINQGIMKELAYLRGQGAVRNLDANSSSSEASAANSYAGADQKRALTPEMVAKYQADTQDVYSSMARRDALLSGEVAQQDATRAATKANTGLADANTTRRIQENDVATAAATLAATESKFLTDVSTPDWWAKNGSKYGVAADGEPTDDQRQTAFLDMYATSPGVPVERKLAVESAIMKHGLAKLQNTALETTMGAEAALRKGGLDSLVKWYDGVDDGDATALEIREVDGGFELFSSAGVGSNRTENVLHTGASKEEIEAKLMGQIRDPGTGMAIAAAIQDMQAKAADINQSEAATASSEASTEFTKAQTGALESRVDLTKEEAGLVKLKARELRQKLLRIANGTTAGLETTAATQKAVDAFVADAIVNMGPDADIAAEVERFMEARSRPSDISFQPIPSGR